MSLPVTNTTDAAVTRLMAGELAKSMWATAKPQTTGDGEDGGTVSSGVDTFATLFTDVLADAIAGVDTAKPKSATAR